MRLTEAAPGHRISADGSQDKHYRRTIYYMRTRKNAIFLSVIGLNGKGTDLT